MTTQVTPIRKGQVVIVRDADSAVNGQKGTYEGVCKDTKLKMVLVDTGLEGGPATFRVAAVDLAPKTLAIVTQPLAKRIAPRATEVVMGTRVNRHYNDDGSVTLYAQGLKIFRTASDQDVEDGVVAEDYDADEAIEKFLKKWFGAKAWEFGKTTTGHNFKNTKKAKADATAQASEKEA